MSRPYMQMQGGPIVANGSSYTENGTDNGKAVQMVYEAVTWDGGDENGTYPLGQYIADALTKSSS